MSPRPPKEISVLVPPDLAPLYPDDPERVGPYLLLGRLGQGATGTVYAAVDPSATGDRLVAVKLLIAPELESPEVFPELERRLRALSGVDPEHVVVPVSFDSDANPPWLAMAYVGGQRLSHYITKRNGLGRGKLIALATGLAEGLSALHARGVSHGSLRPSDVVVESHGPHIMECAITASPERMRGSGATWLSPERHRGGPASPASDVFAWGAIVAFAGTGRLPFGTGEPDEIATRVSRGLFDLDGLDPELRPVVSRALDPDPNRRPSLPEVIGAVIAAWQAGGDGGLEESPDRAELIGLLKREWDAAEPPARVPEVVRLEGHLSRSRPTRVLFMSGALLLALTLVGGGAWALSQLLGGEEEAPSGDVADEVSEPPVEESPEEEAPLTVIARFDPAEQESPAEGPWVYTPVGRDDEPVRGQGIPTHAEWAEQWEVSGSPQEAVIAEDAEVLCAKFCAAPDHVFLDVEGRGTWELTGADFIDYLSWGPVMIVEVTFSERQEDGGPREIVEITELFTD